MKNTYKTLTLLLVFSLFSCESFLEEEVFTQYDPNEFLKDQSGIDALLTGAYSGATITNYDARNYFYILQEFPTDIAWETGGGLNRTVVPIIQFNWDPTVNFFNGSYNKFYGAISRANNVLLVTKGLEGIDQETINKIEGEARFIRALSYYFLHTLFGTTPIIEIPEGASLNEIEEIGKSTPRATEEEYRNYVESDLLFAAQNLDSGGLSSRANKGSAYALLTKFYLNNKEWSKAEDAANQVLALDYSLYDDYSKMFSIDGEDNNEYIFRYECSVGTGQHNNYMAHAFPPNYPTLSSYANYGAQFRTYTAFYETFSETDSRKKSFVESYTPQGSTSPVTLTRDSVGNALNDVRSFKYIPDPTGIGESMGNDIPLIRLADIILSKAEAMNELTGPTEEAIELINRIRRRAHTEEIALSDYNSKEALRDFLLAERARELFTEGVRREDLIRHGKFIQQAIDRGIDAKDYQNLYPLPQQQLDNNPNLTQNPGYN